MKCMYLLSVEHALKLVFACSFFVFLYSANSAAQVYYMDDKGIVYFVEDESLVPAQYKDKMKKVGGEKPQDSDQIDTPTTPASPILGGKDKDIKDKFGNPPSFWREKYKALLSEKEKKEKELRDLESQRDEVARKYESARNRAYFLGDAQSITEAGTQELKVRELENTIKVTLAQIDELNRRLSVQIYDEVIAAGGSPDWLLRD